MSYFEQSLGKKIFLLVFGVFLVASVHANVIVNPSFEVPAVTATTNNVVADDWAIVGNCYGIYHGWASDGAQNQFVGNGTGGVQSVLYQTTSLVAAEGDYQITFDARIQDNNVWPGGYEGTLYYENGGVRVPLATAGATYDGTIMWGSGGWKDFHAYTIDYTVGAGDAAIGKNLGFAFQSTTVSTASWNSYCGVDNVSLSVPPIPRTLPLTFYVDSIAGDDGNTGLATDQAWQTLGPVNAETFIPGDQILFKAETFYTGQLKPQGSGDAGNAIIIDMYGTGSKPRIDGEGLVSPTLYLYNVEYFEVNNLEITNTGPTAGAGRMGVQIRVNNFGTAHGIKIRNLYVHDVNGVSYRADGGGVGINFCNTDGGVPSRFDGLLIEDCHLVRCDRDGLTSFNSSYYKREVNWYPNLNVVIRGNLLEDIGGDGIVIICCDGAVVEYNTVRDAGQRIPEIAGRRNPAVGIWAGSSDNTVFQFNEVGGMLGEWDAQGFDADYNTQNTLFQYNYSHDNLGGFILICSNGDNLGEPENIGCIGTVVRYNLSVRDGFQPTVLSPTFHISGPVSDTEIYNNTVYIGTADVIDIFSYTNWGGWPDGTSAYNNIFYVAGSAGNNTWLETNSVYSNNVWYGSISNIPTDPGAIMADPMLVNPGSGGNGMDTVDGYQLQSGSPCIQAGVSVNQNGNFDFWRNRIDQRFAPDVGMHAFSSTYPGDFDSNGKVDLVDFSLLAGEWLGSDFNFDLNAEGAVDLSDYLIFCQDWLCD